MIPTWLTEIHNKANELGLVRKTIDEQLYTYEHLNDPEIVTRIHTWIGVLNLRGRTDEAKDACLSDFPEFHKPTLAHELNAWAIGELQGGTLLP